MRVKICGLSSEEQLDWAIDAGAEYVGLVHFGPSPRHVDLATMARLANHARGRAALVSLSVNADDATLAAIVAAMQPDILQLHGKETPERVADIRQRFGLPVMKALGISTAEDVAAAKAYTAVVDSYLFDAKPPKDATRPGGLGAVFDWSLIENLDLGRPFMLSGGLTPENVAEAVARVKPFAVDVSSGVESAPGVKSQALIDAFIQAARAPF